MKAAIELAGRIDMEVVIGLLSSLVKILIALGVAAAVVVIVVLFIRDGIKAKKEGRCRNDKITALFTVAMIITALALVLGGLLILLASLVMRSM